jgi:hypothetical protein
LPFAFAKAKEGIEQRVTTKSGNKARAKVVMKARELIKARGRKKKNKKSVKGSASALLMERSASKKKKKQEIEMKGASRSKSIGESIGKRKY